MTGTVPRLHVIVDPVTADAPATVDAVLRGGAPLVQLRAKDVDDARLLAALAPLVAAAHRHSALAVVNDRADLARAAGADGVHGGAHDLPPVALRAVVGPDALVGGTARDPETARRLVDEGVDYLGVGPVYATGSKVGLPDPLGPGMVERVAAAVPVPVIAIAGITLARVPEVLAAGAHGIAVIGAIRDADDPEAATAALVDALEHP